MLCELLLSQTVLHHKLRHTAAQQLTHVMSALQCTASARTMHCARAATVHCVPVACSAADAQALLVPPVLVEQKDGQVHRGHRSCKGGEVRWPVPWCRQGRDVCIHHDHLHVMNIDSASIITLRRRHNYGVCNCSLVADTSADLKLPRPHLTLAISIWLPTCSGLSTAVSSSRWVFSASACRGLCCGVQSSLCPALQCACTAEGNKHNQLSAERNGKHKSRKQHQRNQGPTATTLSS